MLSCDLFNQRWRAVFRLAILDSNAIPTGTRARIVTENRGTVFPYLLEYSTVNSIRLFSGSLSHEFGIEFPEGVFWSESHRKPPISYGMVSLSE